MVLVTLNGKNCTVINSSETQPTIVIPPGAGAGNLKVSIGTSSVETTNFDFIETATITTIAGSTRGSLDGVERKAQFNFPNGISIDKQGNLYITDNNDKGNDLIRKITFD